MISFEAGSMASPPTAGRIARFEDFHDVALPVAFKDFLRAGNGGVPAAGEFRQGGRERLIERALSLLEKGDRDRLPQGEYEIGVVMTQLGARLCDDEDWIGGSQIVPIAALFAGDFVCLDYRGDRANPSVAVWDHERSKDFKPHLETVAPSFDAFLQMLHA